MCLFTRKFDLSAGANLSVRTHPEVIILEQLLELPQTSLALALLPFVATHPDRLDFRNCQLLTISSCSW